MINKYLHGIILLLPPLIYVNYKTRNINQNQGKAMFLPTFFPVSRKIQHYQVYSTDFAVLLCKIGISYSQCIAYSFNFYLKWVCTAFRVHLLNNLLYHQHRQQVKRSRNALKQNAARKKNKKNQHFCDCMFSEFFFPCCVTRTGLL